MPSLDTLAQLTAVGDRWVRDGSPLDVLVDAAFPVIKEAMPELLSFQLYQVQTNQLVHTQTGDSIPLNTVLQLPQQHNGHWLIPLGIDHVIVVDIDAKAETTDPAEWILGSVSAKLAEIVQRQENSQLKSNAHRLARQMEGIVGFGQSIQATFEVDALLEMTLLHLSQIMPTDHVGILMQNPSISSLQVVAYQTDEEVSVVDTTGIMAELELVGTTAYQVWESKQFLMTSDLDQEADLKYTFTNQMRSSMSTPIHQRGAVTGILEVAKRQPDGYSEVDRQMLQQLVSQLSVALENCETYSQSQEIARSKTLVNVITSQLQQQVEIDEIMHVTVRELGRALGAKRARIRLDPGAVDVQSE